MQECPWIQIIKAFTDFAENSFERMIQEDFIFERIVVRVTHSPGEEMMTVKGMFVIVVGSERVCVVLFVRSRWLCTDTKK